MKSPLSFKHGVIFFAALIVSILASTQLSTVSTLFFASENRDTGAINPMREIKLLVDTNDHLSQGIAQKESELLALRDEKSRLTELTNQITEEQKRVGEISAQGTGVQISISTPLTTSALIDLINSLWAHGASAVAVNNVRITELSSGIDKVDTKFLINGKEIIAPYEIIATGDAKLFQTLSTADGEIEHLQNLFPQGKIEIQQEVVSMPAA